MECKLIVVVVVVVVASSGRLSHVDPLMGMQRSHNHIAPRELQLSEKVLP